MEVQLGVLTANLEGRGWAEALPFASRPMLLRHHVSLPVDSAKAMCPAMLRLCALLLILLFVTPHSYAQMSAVLSGTVTDPSGGTVAGAKITVRSLETGAVRTTTTGAAGRYEVFALSVGEYEVRVTKAGFAEAIPQVGSLRRKTATIARFRRRTTLP